MLSLVRRARRRGDGCAAVDGLDKVEGDQELVSKKGRNFWETGPPGQC